MRKSGCERTNGKCRNYNLNGSDGSNQDATTIFHVMERSGMITGYGTGIWTPYDTITEQLGCHR